MSPSSPGLIAREWWQENIADRDNSYARALAARLRRANSVTALCEPKVIQLANRLNIKPEGAARLTRLVCLLVEIREDSPDSLITRLGGSEPILSKLRFERLISSRDDELVTQLRRAISMAANRCNVTKFANDLYFWNDRTRRNWCFEYFGTSVPQEKEKEELK